jgi:hypothetical protein
MGVLVVKKGLKFFVNLLQKYTFRKKIYYFLDVPGAYGATSMQDGSPPNDQ